MRTCRMGPTAACSLMVTAICAALLPGAFGQRGPPSVSDCTISSLVTVGSMANDAFANLDVDAATIVCGDANASVDREVDMTVSAVATAIAEAISDLNITCVLGGDASAQGSFAAEVESRATAIASAFGRLLSNASVCERCGSRVDVVVNSTREITANATLDSFFELNIESQPGQMIEETQRIFEREIEERIVDALATVIATITATDEGCDVEGNVITDVRHQT
eukprot:jgi/Ulvmu1/1036/UM104_0021.1